MTREKYETLSLASLKEIAKIRKLKGISTLNKEGLIEKMLELDEQEEKAKNESDNSNITVSKAETANDDTAVKVKAKRQIKKSDVKAEVQDKKDNTDTVAENKEKAAETEDAGNRDNDSKKAVTKRNGVLAKPEQSPTANKNSEAKADSKADAGSDRRADKSAEDVKASGNANSSTNSDNKPSSSENDISDEKRQLDSGVEASGILEVMQDGYGFIRSQNYLPGEDDVYVAPSQIRRFGLKTGDIIVGNTRVKSANDKFGALLFLKTINGLNPSEAAKRKNFEDLTPIFPNEKLKLETPGGSIAMRIMDLMCPVGKGQRGMIVSPPKAGKTTLLKDVAKSITRNNPEMHLLILLIDERPEEVTDIKESIEGDMVEVIYSTFDELPEHHKRVSEMVIERAKRLVEHGKDVVILLDSITRLTRAYNLTVQPSGRTLSGGLDPAALHMPKRFFGAARNMREGGSLTVLATALIDTGSKMDDVVYEEFKGTGNMEMVLDRKLSEKRVFPAIDIPKSGTRRDDLLLSAEELEAINVMRKAFNGLKPEEAVEKCLDLFVRTRNNREFIEMIKKIRLF